MKRRWIFWLLITGFLWVVITRFTEVKKLVAILTQGQWEWVAAAILLQGLYYLVFTASYQAAFATVEIRRRVRDLLPVVLGSLFVNVVAPSGGASGVALFVDDAARNGHPAARATSATLLQLISDFCAFTLILLFGLIYLFLQHQLKVYEVIGALILLLLISALTTVLVMGLWKPNYLRRLLSWLARVANRLAALLHRSPFLDEGWAEHNAAEFSQASTAIARHPRRLATTMVIAFVAHLLDLASLYFLFLAFHTKIQPGALIAGYAMGILFWIVSITPQGIGVVEGVMTLVYTSLGVPVETATVVALAFRGLTFWLPLGLGFILLRRMKTFSAGQRSLAKSWDVRIVALLTGLMGIVNVLSSLTPSLAERVRVLVQISPLEVRRGGHLTAALAGFALLVLAGSLWRRKQTAWLLTLVVLAFSVISHLVKGLDYEEAALAAALMVYLFALRSHFHALSDPPSIRQGLRMLVAALLFTLAYGVTGFYLLDHHFRVNFGLGAALRQTIIMFTQYYDPGVQPITGFGRYFADSIYVIGAITTGYALLLLVRPVLVRHPATAKERARAQAIVEAYGRSSLARVALLPDKSYFFSSGGSVLAYVVKGRVALVLGDPIGPGGDFPPALQEFKSLCARNDWQPVFYQTLPDCLEGYDAAGFDTLCIGYEGIVDLDSFSLQGGANKGLRSAFNRLTKLGYQAQAIQPPLPDELLTQLRLISDEWLTHMHGSEKHFSLGWFDDDYIRNGPVLIAKDPDGAIIAFANVVPEYRKREVTIDLMRHRRDVISGTMDFLFVSLFQWAQEQGYATFNLGLSSLYGIGESAQDPAIEKFLHFIYDHVNQFYNFKGLHEFKEKFHPAWSPRYLEYPGLASLPAITVALLRADS